MNIYRRLTLAMITSLFLAGSTIALADPPHRHWRGNHHHSHYHDHPRWRDGHWHHGKHGGRFGWWWITAGTWYYYPAPVYPYPDPYLPPTVVIEPEPAPQQEPIWYYCKSSRNYYPYVSVCPEGWRTVAAQPPDPVDRYDDERDDDE